MKLMIEGMIFMKEFTMNTKPTADKRILTSQNSPEIAERIKQASAEILKRNYNLYKELENK